MAALNRTVMNRTAKIELRPAPHWIYKGFEPRCAGNMFGVITIS